MPGLFCALARIDGQEKKGQDDRGIMGGQAEVKQGTQIETIVEGGVGFGDLAAADGRLGSLPEKWSMRPGDNPEGAPGEGGGVMKDLKARDVMVRPVVAARKNAPVRDVVFQFLNGFYSGMPVTDDQGSVIGVVTELDILEAVLGGKELVKITAGDIMTAKPITADVETPLAEVVKIMKEKNIIRLPVTEEGKLVGIVARCDILTTLIEPEFVTYM
jgi:CBS domain-containing protein